MVADYVKEILCRRCSVIVMDVLNSLSLTETSSLLQSLGGSTSDPHRLSLYVNDVARFLSPAPSELLTIRTTI